MTNTHTHNAAAATCADALRLFPGVADAPAHCAGPIAWRDTPLHHGDRPRMFCEAHGAFHAALSPYAGYRRVES